MCRQSTSFPLNLSLSLRNLPLTFSWKFVREENLFRWDPIKRVGGRRQLLCRIRNPTNPASQPQLPQEWIHRDEIHNGRPSPLMTETSSWEPPTTHSCAAPLPAATCTEQGGALQGLAPTIFLLLFIYAHLLAHFRILLCQAKMKNLQSYSRRCSHPFCPISCTFIRPLYTLYVYYNYAYLLLYLLPNSSNQVL